MTLSKLFLALGLSLSLVACVDEVDDQGRPLPTEGEEIADGDGIPSEPTLPDDETCASAKKADGACVPSN